MDVDEEIEVAEDTVLDLRKRHNALVTAANAPADILYDIFSFYPVKFERKIKISRPPTWLALLMVCGHWRETYISNPTLWKDTGRIYLPEMADIAGLSIERAAGVSTDLWFHLEDPETLDATLPKAVPANVSWLKSLKITGVGYKLAKFLRVFNDVSAPRLEALRIELDLDELTSYGHEFSQSQFFAGQVPSLKALTMKNCSSFWESPLLNVKTITELDIEGHSSLQRPTIEQLLAAISVSPALESLRLKNCLPDVPHLIPFATVDRVELPRMSRFELISDSPFALCAVAVRVRVPAAAKYFIRCHNSPFVDGRDFNMQHVQALAGAIHTHAFVRGPMTRLREGIPFGQHLLAISSDEITDPYQSFIEFGSMRYGEMENVDSPFDFMRKTQFWDPCIGLSLTWEPDFEPNTTYELRSGLTTLTFGAFLSTTRLGTLKGAHISGDTFHLPHIVIMAFSTATNLETLTVSGQAQIGALGAMSGLSSFDMPGAEPLFPILKRMCLCDISLDMEVRDGNTALAHLRATLQRRKDELDGLRVLDRLGLFHNAITAAQAEELGPLVGHGSVDVIGIHGEGAEKSI